MRLIFLIFMLAFSTNVFSSLQIIPTAGNGFKITGDMHNGSYILDKLNKQFIPNSALLTIPSSNGVWIFVTYKGNYLPKPIYTRPNLTEIGQPEYHLANAGNTFLSAGITLERINEKDLDSVGLYICDFKLKRPSWTCLRAQVNEGNIEIPPIPEPTLVCSTLNTIELRHGNLSMDSVQNNKANATAYISCNRSATVQISIAPDTQGRVNLSGITGLSSSLYVENIGGGNIISVPVSTTMRAVNFYSVLSSNSSLTAGTFQGSSYILLSFP